MPEQRINREQAENIARRHPTLESLAQRRSRSVLVQPKPPHGEESGDNHHVLVGFYDYEYNQSLIVLVDMKAEKVLAVEKALAPFQLSKEERQEAEDHAAADFRVEAFLAGRKPNPLTRLYFPRHVAPIHRSHRFAIVFLRPSNTERRYAVVDLSEPRVVDVLTRRDLTGR
ncbi:MULTISPECIES: hypothetical protein [Paraburkholderia]|uniref:hypothetical protein n=1 Tax=Paraburkholderia TaxID=1822464 RepID=UPI0038BBD23A